MAGRQGSTFQKRQKEARRTEKRRMKEEKRSARRLEKAQAKAALSPEPAEPDVQSESQEDGGPGN